jgi:uncharacterized membrane protein (GlpM family)
MTTLVSSFYSEVNKRVDRNFENYVTYGTLLLKASIPKIIFTDEHMYKQIKQYENNNTKIVLTKKEDIYFYNFTNKLTNFQINTTTPSKDTIDYIFIMCNKTELIKKAIELNVFNTENFTWVDFGIRHIFKNNTDDEFITKIENLTNKVYDKVRIACIWDLNNLYNYDVYKEVLWYFAGGVFGGDKQMLTEFAIKTKRKCIQIIHEKNTIMWEVNVWYLIYLENKYLFDYYNCDHNNSIIDNY